MGGDLLQHVIEEADAGRDGDRAGRVEVDRADDTRLLRIADGLTGAVSAGRRATEAERAQQPVVDLCSCGDGQPQTVAGPFGSDAETGEGGEDRIRIGRAGHDHRAEAGLDDHLTGQGLDQAIAFRADEGDAACRLHHPRGVERLKGEADGDLGQGVGLQHRGEAGQGRRLGQGGTDAGTGEAVCEREAAQNDQICVVADPCGGRGGIGEFGEGFVDHQKRGGDPFGHLGHGLGRAEGAEDDGTGRGVFGGPGVEGGEGPVRLSIGGLDALAVAGGESEDQFQSVGQATHRQDAVRR